MNFPGIVFLLVGLLASLCTIAQDKKFNFALDELASHDRVHLKKMQKGSQTWLEFKADTLPTFFFLPGPGDGFAWQDARFLVMEVENPEVQNQILSFRFFENHFDLEPTRTIQVSILPAIRSQVVIPLNLLAAGPTHLPRFPGQLKGIAKGRSLNPANIQRVEISVGPLQLPHLETKIKIFHLALAVDIPKLHEATLLPVVDSLGQWLLKNWKGKTWGTSEIKKRLTRELARGLKTENAPPSNQKIMKTGTGFFSTYFDGRRWWLIDPAGKPFIASGVNLVKPVVASPLPGLEYFHQYLPDPVNEGKDSYSSSGKTLMFNYLATNLRKALGSEWLEKWRALVGVELKKAKFNCLGTGAESGLVTCHSQPYFIQLAHLPRTQNLLSPDVPDPFDPTYKDSVDHFARQLKPYKGDVHLIGYFLGNQPGWSFGNRNLAAEVFQSRDSSFAKKELNRWLRRRYQGDVAKLNKTWREKFSSFEEVDTSQIKPGPEALDDLMSFTEIMIDSLISPICRSVKKEDPFHLNFGFRFSVISQDIWFRTHQKSDVYSVSSSGLDLTQTGHIAERSGRPVLISDFQVGALDRGLPSGGPTATATTSDRGKAIRSLMEESFSRNEVVGMLYSSFYDQPLLGRADGENYQIGLMDVCHREYSAIWNAMKKANENALKLAIHSKNRYFRPVAPARLVDN